MNEYQIHLVLKSGKEFKFMVCLENLKSYTDEFQKGSAGRWFSFVSDDFIKYTVDKNEIAVVGVSMNEEEIHEQDKKNADIENEIKNNKIVQNKVAKAFTQWK